MAVVRGQREHLCGDVLGQAVVQLGSVGMQHLGNTRNLRRSGGRRARAAAGDQHVHIAAALKRGGDGIEGRTLDGGVVVFGNNK